MANREVNLTKRVRTAAGLRYCPAVRSANGRVKPDVVMVNGKAEAHPEGAYYLEWRDKGKRIRLSVGKDAQSAAAMRLSKETELNNGNGTVPIITSNGHRSLTASVSKYLEEVELTKKPKTHAAYATALDYFLESCRKPNLEAIDRTDLLKFAAFLRDEKEQSPRSCWNKFSNVMTFLKAQGIRGLTRKNDWPKYVEEEPEIYEREDLDTLFAACDADEKMWFEFFLMTGMREQEVMYCYWSDINLNVRFKDGAVGGVVRVTHKPDRNWTPKAYKEREIPIPPRLVNSLKEWKKKSRKNCNLVFPTAGCNPKLNFLDELKVVAERAKLDKREFWLHKFRATFATRHLQEGVDLRTVQVWLGHTDIESTMRYLKPSRSQQVHAMVSKTFAWMDR